MTLLIFSSISFAQSAGNSGLSFLKLGFGARNISMGDVGTSLSNDVSSLFYNPARLGEKSNTEILVMHNEWIQGIQSEVIGVKFNFMGFPFGVGFNSTSIKDIPIRRIAGDAEGIFNAHYFFGTIASAVNVFEDFNVGFAVKYIYEGIWVDESAGWGFDAAASYKFNPDIRFSAAVRNIGSMNKLRNESTKLPTEIRAGGSYELFYPSAKMNIVVGAEFQKYIDTDDSHLNFGAEFLYDHLFAVRLGYQTLYDSKSITTGVGLHWGNLDFDYALIPIRYDLGTGHTFSVKFGF